MDEIILWMSYMTSGVWVRGGFGVRAGRYGDYDTTSICLNCICPSFGRNLNNLEMLQESMPLRKYFKFKKAVHRNSNSNINQPVAFVFSYCTSAVPHSHQSRQPELVLYLAVFSAFTTQPRRPYRLVMPPPPTRSADIPTMPQDVHVHSWFLEPIPTASLRSSWTGDVRLWGLLHHLAPPGHPTPPSSPLWWRSSALRRRLGPRLLETKLTTRIHLTGPIFARFASRHHLSPATLRAFAHGFPSDWQRLLIPDFRSFFITVYPSPHPNEQLPTPHQPVAPVTNSSPTSTDHSNHPSPLSSSSPSVRHSHPRRKPLLPIATPLRPSTTTPAVPTPAQPRLPGTSTIRKRVPRRPITSALRARAIMAARAAVAEAREVHDTTAATRSIPPSLHTKHTPVCVDLITPEQPRRRSARLSSLPRTCNPCNLSAQTPVLIPTSSTRRRSNRLSNVPLGARTRSSSGRRGGTSRQDVATRPDYIEKAESSGRRRLSQLPDVPQEVRDEASKRDASNQVNDARKDEAFVRRRSTRLSDIPLGARARSVSRRKDVAVKRSASRRVDDTLEDEHCGRRRSARWSNVPVGGRARRCTHDKRTTGRKSNTTKELRVAEESKTIRKRRSSRASGVRLVAVDINEAANVMCTQEGIRQIASVQAERGEVESGKKRERSTEPTKKKLTRRKMKKDEEAVEGNKENLAPRKAKKSKQMATQKNAGVKNKKKKQTKPAASTDDMCEAVPIAGRSCKRQTQAGKTTARSRPRETRRALSLLQEHEVIERSKERKTAGKKSKKSTSKTKDSESAECADDKEATQKGVCRKLCRAAKSKAAKNMAASIQLEAAQARETDENTSSKRSDLVDTGNYKRRRISFSSQEHVADITRDKEDWSRDQKEAFVQARNIVAADDVDYWETIADKVSGKSAAECQAVWERTWGPASERAKHVRRRSGRQGEATPDALARVRAGLGNKRVRETGKFRAAVRKLAEAPRSFDSSMEPRIATPRDAAAADAAAGEVLGLREGTPGTEVRARRAAAEAGGNAVTPELLARGREQGTMQADQYVTTFLRRLVVAPPKMPGDEAAAGRAGKGTERRLSQLMEMEVRKQQRCEETPRSEMTGQNSVHSDLFF